MGVPWNPEWEQRIQEMMSAAADTRIGVALSDGTTMSAMTPGSVPSLASTHKYSFLAIDTDSLGVHTALDSPLNAWKPLVPSRELVAESGGRPVMLRASGCFFSSADAGWISLAVNGAEVTNTQYGLALITSVSVWVPFSIQWLLEQPPPRFRVSLVGRRSAATNTILIGSQDLRTTISAVEV